MSKSVLLCISTLLDGGNHYSKMCASPVVSLARRPNPHQLTAHSPAHPLLQQQNRAGSFPSTPQNSKKPRMSAKEKKAHEKRQKELDAQKKKQLKELMDH